jgi:phage/plasmid-like protein (TIGR03299 family)
VSNETTHWLNNNCLIGFTDKYGRAWHYSENDQGNESNHYPMAIPVADVQRRLFDWEAVECEATYQVNDRTFALPGKVIARSDTGAHLGTFADGYQPHQYSEWLLDKVGGLLDVSEGALGIGSAVLLQSGAVAAVQVEAPESVNVGGDELRPFILATTSFNGKFVTSYKRGTTRVVCDNTLDEFHNTASAEFKIKHTKHSKARIDEVRSVLEITFKHQEAELKEIEDLMNQAMTDLEFDRLVKMVDPIKTEEERGITRTGNRHSQYRNLWEHDDRIGSYRGTAWGAIQVFNTYGQHMNSLRATTVRPEANMLNFMGGKVGKNDNEVVTAIKSILNKPTITV